LPGGTGPTAKSTKISRFYAQIISKSLLESIEHEAPAATPQRNLL
jgi:hypothetical protein